MPTTIAALVENKTGVLARVAGLFTARGLNIESLNVAPTADPTLSQLTIVLDEPVEIIEQVVKLINRVIEVVKVSDFTRLPHIERELALLVVELPSGGRPALLDQARRQGATVIDLHGDTVVFEVTGSQAQIQSIIQIFGEDRLRELVRTGRIVLPRTSGARRKGFTPRSRPATDATQASPDLEDLRLIGEPPA